MTWTGTGTVTVVFSNGDRHTFDATAWTLDDDMQLDILNGDDLIASFAPGAWQAIWRGEVA
jgi:hypothetical protein